MKQFVKAVLITTILSVTTRALGLFIKIYISREIGAEALGYYQISLSVFFLLCTLVTSGIPLVISRMIAKNEKTKPHIVFSGLVLATTISIIVCLIVVLFPSIFIKIWGQNSSLSVLYCLLPAIIFTGLYVPFRGAFWGSKDFFLLGFTELVEQLLRFLTCLVMFNAIIPLSGEEIAGATYSIACVLSSLFAIIMFFIKGGRIKANKKFIKPLLVESAPIATMRIGSSVVSLIISVIFPAMLVKFGLSQAEAVGSFGIITGMVLPLLTIPGTLISSISVALIPEISGKSDKFVTRQINLALSYSIIISFVLFPVFLILGEPIGFLLFNDPLAGELLRAGSCLLIPMGVNQISSAILNAIGLEKRSLFNYLVGAVLMIICVIFLPKYIGVYSLVAGFLFMSVVSTLLNLLAITKYLTTYSLKTFFSSLLLSVPPALIAHFSYSILINFTSLFLSLLVSVGLAITTILVLYQIFNFIDIKDYLPKKIKIHA